MAAGSHQGTPPLGFVPRSMTVVIGLNNTVVWVNRDSVMHTAHSDQGYFNAGQLLPGESSKPVTFTRAGLFPYHCDPHFGWTRGIIIVKSQ